MVAHHAAIARALGEHLELPEDVLDALASSRWPHRVDAELSNHVASCAICRDVITVAAAMQADPERVTVPFLSIVGAGDSRVFARQAEEWHREIRSERKAYVLLDAASGADGHCQVNNRLRLVQECCAWLDEIFAAA